MTTNVLDRRLEGNLLKSMHHVKKLKNTLNRLNRWWENTTQIGKINSQKIEAALIDSMVEIKEQFVGLQGQLINNLVSENFQKIVLEGSSQAQVAIDLIIRNLFERTADVGFLATDDDICRFLAHSGARKEGVDFIVQRLQEYVAKYSVYDEIVIIDTAGNVSAHLDASSPITTSKDPLIQKTLAADEYVETFGYSDIRPQQDRTLIYSHKIIDPSTNVSIGVLCLCFRFENEIEGIFNKLHQEDKNIILSLLDKSGRVIASNNPNTVPVHTRLDMSDEVNVVNYKGIDYLAKTMKTSGYEGFYGLGWCGHVLIPLHAAFQSGGTEMDLEVDEKIVMESTLFSDEFKSIAKGSNYLNADLALVVLNGQISAARKDAKEFIPILNSIKDIGCEIAEVISYSVSNLHSTVISSRLYDTKFIASLAVDIMDRNLYERANDCRWWALTSSFRRILMQREITPQDIQTMTDILQYINGLYTVYTNLFTYDNQGIIIVVSNPHEAAIVGKKLDHNYVGKTLTIKDSQDYCVSRFHTTDLYTDRPTYIYNASITEPGNSQNVIGGIGIVFDAEPQFTAMLADVLPQDKKGNVLAGCFGVFTDRKGQVISSTIQDIKPGSKLALATKYFSFENGGGTSELIEFQGKNYVIGCMTSTGYREYKRTDNYQNDVIAFVFVLI